MSESITKPIYDRFCPNILGRLSINWCQKLFPNLFPKPCPNSSSNVFMMISLNEFPTVCQNPFFGIVIELIFKRIAQLISECTSQRMSNLIYGSILEHISEFHSESVTRFSNPVLHLLLHRCENTFPSLCPNPCLVVLPNPFQHACSNLLPHLLLQLFLNVCLTYLSDRFPNNFSEAISEPRYGLPKLTPNLFPKPLPNQCPSMFLNLLPI